MQLSAGILVARFRRTALLELLSNTIAGRQVFPAWPGARLVKHLLLGHLLCKCWL